MKDLSSNISSTSSSNQTIASSTSSSASTPCLNTSKALPSTITLSGNSNQMNENLVQNGLNPTVTSSASPNDEEDTVEYMDIDNDTSEEPTSSQQFDLSDVPQLVKRPLRSGEHWYILDKKWFDACMSFIEDGSNNTHPGKIDNSPLLVVKNNAQKNYTEPMFRMKPNLTEGEDIAIVPEEVWNILVDNFEIVTGIGGNPIRCPILEKKGKNLYLMVEIYPLELRLALYGSKEDMVAQYSRNCTLQKIVSDMRSLFRISEERPAQLWNNATLLVAHSDNIASSSSSSILFNNSHISANNSSSIPSPPPPPPSPSSSCGDQKQSTSNFEQRLGELELAPNAILTLELQNPDGTWPSSRTKLGAITRSKVASGVPIADPGVCGLMNLGNTCFMNSALQCLSNTPTLTKFLISDRYLDDINLDNPLGMGGEIARRYAELIKAIWSGHHVSLSPREFKIAVSRFAPQFSGFAQHDCQELMAFLLDGLHEDLNRVKKKPYIEAKDGIEKRPDVEVAHESWNNYKRRNDSIIVDTFHSQLKSTLVCPECKLVSVTFDPNCYLTLPLPYKRERSVDVVFVPAISKRPTYNLPKRVLTSTSTVTSSSLVESSSLAAITTNLIPVRSILIENVMIPKSGCVTEISAAVAKVLNESMGMNGAPVLNRQVDSSKLRVANVYMNRLNKLFSNDENFNQHFDDVVVFEEDDSPVSTSADGACQTRSLSLKSNGYSLPVFIREATPNTGEYSISRPFFINIKHLTYEDIREAIFQELLSLIKPEEADEFIQAMNEESVKEDKSKYVLFDSGIRNQTSKRQNAASLQDGSDGEASEVDDEEEGNKQMENSMGDDEEEEEEDEGVEAASGSGYSTRNRDQPPNPPFTISVVNMYATSEFSTLRAGVRLDSFINTYLSVNINTKLAHKFLPKDLNTFRQIKLTSMMPPSSIRAAIPRTSITLGECINQFTTTEKLGSDDPWYCPRCKKHQMADKKFDIWSLPKILIIHLKRFQYSRLHRDKLDVMVDFPTRNLDMTPYVLHNQENEAYLYNLIGVANHYGGLGGGHYTAFAKNAHNNNWYNFDDSSVSAVSENAVVTKSAYVLFYQLQKDDEIIEPDGSENAAPADAALDSDVY